MPVRQLTERCWVASWPGDTRTDKQAAYGSHYASAGCPSLTGRGWFHIGCGGCVGPDDECPLCSATGLRVLDEPRTIELRGLTPRPLIGCWEVTCDTCELELDDDDTGIVHVGSHGDAVKAAVAYGWTVYDDGRAYCEADAPPPGSGQPITLPDPEQPALFAPDPLDPEPTVLQ